MTWLNLTVATVPFEFPHTESVLVWGDPAVGKVTVEEINTAFEDPKTGLKQLIQRVGTAKCDCSKTMCSGHGRWYIAPRFGWPFWVSCGVPDT